MTSEPILFTDYSAFEALLERSEHIEAHSHFFHKALRVQKALDRDILEWTKPTSCRLSQLLNWLQEYLNEHHEDAYVDANNYRLFARGLAADTLFNFQGLHPEPPKPDSPFGIVRDEDIYWRCIAICSAAWTVEPELWERRATSK